jgi:hypothetical protein
VVRLLPSVKTVEAGGPRGYDAGKMIKGHKCHAMVDTDGRALVLQAHPADVQDRDGAVPLLQASRRSFPFIELAFAGSAYNADRARDATSIDSPGLSIQDERRLVAHSRNQPCNSHMRVGCAASAALVSAATTIRACTPAAL